jgi:hypothetical protein
MAQAAVGRWEISTLAYFSYLLGTDMSPRFKQIKNWGDGKGSMLNY